MKLVLFTDLDGTLLDDSYSFAPALPALEVIKAKGIPCVICSSKTRSEIEYYRRLLSNPDPFIVENGGALYIPRGYFAVPFPTGQGHLAAEGEYTRIGLGKPYPELREELARLRAKGFPVRGFGDMPASEIARLTGLPLEEASRAKEREFDEPFLMEGSREKRQEVCALIREDGYSCTAGLFLHLTGPHDKGRAATILVELYKRAFDSVITAGFGDAPNDIPLLRVVDRPVVAARRDGSIHPEMKGLGFATTRGAGPEGWNRAVLDLVAILNL